MQIPRNEGSVLEIVLHTMILKTLSLFKQKYRVINKIYNNFPYDVRMLSQKLDMAHKDLMVLFLMACTNDALQDWTP